MYDMVAVVRAMLTTSAESTGAINSGLRTVYSIHTNIANNGATVFTAEVPIRYSAWCASFRGSTGNCNYCVFYRWYF
jgi:hypothetical protein